MKTLRTASLQVNKVCRERYFSSKWGVVLQDWNHGLLSIFNWKAFYATPNSSRNLPQGRKKMLQYLAEISAWSIRMLKQWWTKAQCRSKEIMVIKKGNSWERSPIWEENLFHSKQKLPSLVGWVPTQDLNLGLMEHDERRRAKNKII